MKSKRMGGCWLQLGTALLLLSCAGRSIDQETDTNTNWVERCQEGDISCSSFDPRIDRSPSRAMETEIAPPNAPDTPRADPEVGALDSCVVRCDAVLSLDECRGAARIPSLVETTVNWQGMNCAAGPLLEGHCGDSTHFLLRGGEAGEVRYFGPDGAFIGLSSFRSSPDPSTCNGVRRWPQQVTCDAPVVTRELCADSASGHAGAPLDASDWLEDLGQIE